jgi:hypothetical protein
MNFSFFVSALKVSSHRGLKANLMTTSVATIAFSTNKFFSENKRCDTIWQFLDMYVCRHFKASMTPWQVHHFKKETLWDTLNKKLQAPSSIFKSMPTSVMTESYVCEKNSLNRPLLNKSRKLCERRVSFLSRSSWCYVLKSGMSKDKMSKGKMLKDKMSKGKMSKGKMSKGKMSKGKMSKGKMSKGKMLKGKMLKGKMLKGKMLKDKMSKDKMSKGKMSKYKMSKGKMLKDKMSKKMKILDSFDPT